MGFDVGFDADVVVEAPKSELLAGTSSRKEAKIWLSSGCVHRMFAVAVGSV